MAPNGRIDLAYYDLSPQLRHDVYSISSCDGGRTFFLPERLTDVSYDATIGGPQSGTVARAKIAAAGPVGTVSSNDRIAVAWTDSRRGTKEPDQPNTNRQDVFFDSLPGRSCEGQPAGPDPGQLPSPSSPPGGGAGPGTAPGAGGGPDVGSLPRPAPPGPSCGDLTRPRSSVSKRSRLSRARVLLNGRTTDLECSPDGRVVRTERKLARVEISVATRRAKRCRFLISKRRLSVVRGVDRDGNVEVKKRSTNRVRLRAK